MSRVPKATANQFVKEATVGLLVVGALLALMVHALFRRFGVWQPSAHPKEVVAARVYTRIPTAANANASTEANLKQPPWLKRGSSSACSDGGPRSE
ncbi:MAG: hypothetical protein R3B96_13635 [Pirellulaceae bacterium]